MTEQLAKASEEIGLKMNIQKAKTITNTKEIRNVILND